METSNGQIVSRRAPSFVRSRAKRQHGSIAILSSVLLIVIIGFCGLALDLGRLYNRKAELQNVADTIALSAARELNGTTAGITKALEQAAYRMNSTTPQHLSYQYSKLSMTWSDAAIQFSQTPAAGGTWHDLDSAKANPGQLLYVRVNTANLDAAYGQIETLLMHVLDKDFTNVSTSASATAGRSTLNAVPFAVCAMRPEAALNRSTELVEYGFRRGISYDLMRLNPNGTSAGQNYLINPFAPAGTTGASLSTADLSAVQPYACTGTLAIPGVTGGQITVQSPFPLASFFSQLNSRFDSYTAPCSANSAPPDGNVKVYQKATGTWVPWMNVQPTGQGAVEYAEAAGGKLWTIADPDTTTAGTAGTAFGPLWQYARPVKWSAYVPGTPEPESGYPYTSLFVPADWATLYNPGQPVVKPNTYPDPKKLEDSRTPYESSITLPPSGKKGIRQRRVLNVPLLACPVTGTSATVLGIGKFFMTVPATASSIFAEFAGAVPAQSVGGQVELYP